MFVIPGKTGMKEKYCKPDQVRQTEVAYLLAGLKTNLNQFIH